MATINHVKTFLSQAIDGADDATVRWVLKSIWDESDECSFQAAQYLLVHDPEGQVTYALKRKASGGPPPQESAHKRAKAEDDSHEAAQPPVPALKPRYETCEHCSEVYDVMENYDEACCLHEGELEIDMDHFVDDDEVIELDGAIDTSTDWRVEAYPYAFTWSCCDGKADGEPCLVGRHEPTQTTIV
ncbi:Uu.00g070300.m01.CDS01 [Anthostomella pinea]|uniref:Uu.00g070300.m01.CDS01 n=1 Tax=Anthostomella pinea TaxID=933095 RepID=A0AAI8YNP5_9PEZI|nr:Uu.00g070300.m01.CDS01 [Anthostomella pinea]